MVSGKGRGVSSKKSQRYNRISTAKKGGMIAIREQKHTFSLQIMCGFAIDSKVHRVGS